MDLKKTQVSLSPPHPPHQYDVGAFFKYRLTGYGGAVFTGHRRSSGSGSGVVPEIPPAGRQSRVRGRGRGRVRGDGGRDQPAGRHGRRSPAGRDRPAADQRGARGHQTATGPGGRGGEQRRRRLGPHVRQPGVGSADQESDRRQRLGTHMGKIKYSY